MTETSGSQAAPAAPEDPTAQALRGALRRARWTLLWERVWPAVAALATAIGLFLALSWLGLWLVLPPLARAIGLSILAIFGLAAFIPALFVRRPTTEEVLRRLDRGSGLPHRPATAMADTLAVTPQDAYSLALWRTHVARAAQSVASLKAGLPTPGIAARDPYALRALILIGCFATFIAAGGERWKRIEAAFDWQGVVRPANFRVDAWVTPPAYTGRPPVILPGVHPGETAAAEPEGPFTVPANSTLTVRSTGAVNLNVTSTSGLNAAPGEAHPPTGTEEHRFVIAATGAVTVRGAGADITWPFNAVPDKPPTIALTRDPEQQNRGSLLLSYRLEDDYGVKEAQATFVRKDPPPTGGTAPRPLYGTPDFPLILPQAHTRSGTGQTIKDLTDHPWAGADVTMTLVARDEAGNEGKSEPFSFRLPERAFTKPLARALIEQRRNLALDANTRPLVITALDALAIAPDKFTPDAGTYLGLRTIFWSLVRAKGDEDLRDVVSRLWQMAVGIEDGNMSDAQEALRNAEEALRQAIERGASDDEIRQLMDQLRAAMDRFTQALAEQLRNHPQLSRPLDRNARVLSQRDMQSMLDRLENLARSGAKDAARQMLQQLQQMMENLQMASPDGNGDDNDDMMSALDELGDMIHQQQDLRDRTYKQGQDQRQGMPRGQRGRQGQPQQPGDSMGDLRQNQQALRDRLNKLLDELRNRGLGQGEQDEGKQGQAKQGQGQPGQGQQGQGQQGQDQLEQLGRAGDAMGDAEGELGSGNADSAVEAQGRALEAMRKGAQGLAQSMQQQMGQGPGIGRPGRLGQPRADQDTDPLGRPMRGHDYGDDTTVRIPGEIDVQRARRIIEELRKRFGDLARPQEELDYIERLLKNY